jgi:hypothetical protein
MAEEMGATTSDELSTARDRLVLGILAAKRDETGLTT